MHWLSLSLVLDVLSAVAAIGAAGFWWTSAGVRIPVETVITAHGSDWQLIANALLDQSMWSSCGAAYAAIAAVLQAAAIIARRVRP